MKRKIAALSKVDAHLPNLQHKIHSDAPSYKADFLDQYDQYSTMRSLFLEAPTSTDDSGIVHLRDIIDFVSHVAECYRDITADFAGELIQLLRLHHAILDADLRDKIVGSLMLLRKKDLISSEALLDTLWPLLISTPSKNLRALLYQKIVADLRAANSKGTNHKLNRRIQTACHNLITSDPSSPKAWWAVRLTRELWKRRIWTDAKAVSIVELAALSQDATAVTSGIRFFLGGDQEREEAIEDEGDDDAAPDMTKLRHQAGINKKTVKRNKELKAAVAKVKRHERRKNAAHTQQMNFGALHLLRDPQGFAEKLFQQHLQPSQPKVRLNLQQKLLVLQLVSRLVGLHNLTLAPLYSYYLKYLTPRQPSVTSFLASLAQSTHKLVPPDALEPLVQKIANEFVSEAAAAEVASAGLNGIREICVRQPLVMNDTLLQDLVQYRKSKDKGVQMAARGLLNLYREVDASMLKKRDRGRDTAMTMDGGGSRPPKFGEVQTGEIEGLELLEKWKDEQEKLEGEEDGDAGWRNWDVESNSSNSSGGWIDVESDGEGIQIIDSEVESQIPKAVDSGPRGRTVEVFQKENRKNEGQPKDGIDLDDDRGVSCSDSQEAAREDKARVSQLATTRILTPADLAKLRELRQSVAISANLPSEKRRKLQQQQELSQRHADDEVTADQISGLARLSRRMTKEEKVRMAKGDPDETNNHRSTAARRKEKRASEAKGTTNKEKARRKNFMMTLSKAKRKGKRSLAEHRKILKNHVDRARRGGRRGNR